MHIPKHFIAQMKTKKYNWQTLKYLYQGGLMHVVLEYSGVSIDFVYLISSFIVAKQVIW